MEIRLKTLVWLLVGAFLLSGCGAAPEIKTTERIDSIMKNLIAETEPGAAVLVVKDGQVVHKNGYGLADIRTGNPVRPGTNFRLASLTKQFTAAAVMVLAREGKLTYEQTLSEFFPDFPDYGKTVTVRNLLTHTSGLPDYESLLPPPDPSRSIEEQQINDYRVLELLKKEKNGKFPPGTEWDYSNSGYVVLGLIVEKVSGLRLSRFMEEKIFRLAGMEATLLYERGFNQVPERAFGHSKQANLWVVKDQSLTSATRGDGGIYSSVEDMINWDRALREKTLLNENELKLALTPVVVPGRGAITPGGNPTGYGFGWFINPWKGHRLAWHYGETAGFRTAIYRFYDSGLTVVVLANREDIDASGLALKLAEDFLD